jgi:CBS domain-containing protein
MAENQPTPNGEQEYQDPLENYEPKTYKDPLEQSLAEETVEAIEAQPFVSASPDAPVSDVIGKLVDLNVACVLIEEQGKLIGVFSERDALNKVALEYEDVKNRPVRDFMSPNPIYVYESDSSSAALSVMAATGYRHVPVVNLDEKLVGIVSPNRVADFLTSHLGDLSDTGPFTGGPGAK